MSLLSIEGLRVSYRTQHGALHAVDGVDLALEPASTLGLVGESGSGKSTLARAIVGLAPVIGGRIAFRGEDVSRLSRASLKGLRRNIQLVFQDPYSSLNPRMSIGEAIEEPMRVHLDLSRADRRRETQRLLELVGLAAADAPLYPLQFSGGQRQRIAIARALAVDPALVIADEITSSLDVSVQAMIVNLMRDLQSATGVAFLFISHNLAVVRYLAPRIAVMHLGKLVEVASAEQLFARPSHPYTRVLIDSVPRLHRREHRLAGVEGDLPDPYYPPSGCRFHTRCPVGPLAHPEREACRTEDPHAGAGERPHRSACHFAGESAGETRAAEQRAG